MIDDKLLTVWLSNDLFLSAAQKRFLLELFGSAAELYGAEIAEIEQVFSAYPQLAGRASASAMGPLFDKDLTFASQCLSRAKELGCSVLTASDSQYPPHLAELPDAPLALYAKGDLSLLQTPGVAIVGTRRASPYGIWAARELSSRLADAGAVIVSGMAEGVDSAAQSACLDRGGGTIAVFGTGVDVCFPQSSRRLYERIERDGLMVSEYPPGTKGRPAFFPLRNRIISGLSAKCIIVEGTVKSGSLITANLALEQGRDVFAVPGNINQPASLGVNRLIMDGACPILDPDEVCSLLGYADRQQRRRLASLSPSEKRVYDRVRQNGSCSLPQLADAMPDVNVVACVVSLSLKGLVVQQGQLIQA